MTDMITELLVRISDLEKKVENICRLGKVIKVHEETAKVDVEFEDQIIKERPFSTMRAGKDQTYWLPSTGELGFLFSPSGELGNAIFLPGIFYKGVPPTAQSEDKHITVYRDGTKEEIDTDAHSHKFTIGNTDKFRRETNETEIKDSFDTSYIKQNKDETEIKRTGGTIYIKRGTTSLKITATAITGYIGGVGKIKITAATVNVNGATFTGGATNMRVIDPISGPLPVIYTSSDIS